MAVLLRDSPIVNLPSRAASSQNGGPETRDPLARKANARINGGASVLEGFDQVSAPRDVALVCMSEGIDAQVRSWIEEACSASDLTEIPACMTVEAANLAAPFDIRLIIGGGVQELVGWLVKSGEYQEWRPSIALLANSTPQQRGYLLRCGFDDVFDVSEMDSIEGLMRICAIWSGYSRYRLAFEYDRRLERELARMSSDGSWTEQQRQFLTLLLKSPSGFVRYEEFGAKLPSSAAIVPRSYLKVIASYIRKNLSVGYRLSAISKRGYFLSFNDEVINFMSQ